MKRFYFLLIPIFVLLFGVSASAAGETFQDLNDFCYDVTGYYFNPVLQSYISGRMETSHNDICIRQNDASTISVFIGNFTGDDRNTFTGNQDDYTLDNGYWYQTRAFNRSNFSIDVSTYTCFFMSDYSIDFDVPYFDFMLPRVNFTVDYGESSPNLGSTYVPLHFEFGESDYYIQSLVLFNQPSEVLATYGRGGISFSTSSDFSTSEDIYTGTDYKKYNDYNNLAFDSILDSLWQDTVDNDYNMSYAGDYNANIKNSCVSRYENLRKVLTFGGTSVQVWLRYFYVNSDNQFVVGQWTVWSSYNPDTFQDVVPDYYIPYNPANGSTSSSTDISMPDVNLNSIPVVWNPVSTGPTNVDVKVNENVPNYPDYPTISTYNKDNLLVQTINDLTSLQTFMGDFTSFCVASFAFIPVYIWTIIGVGFSLSIVVMFVKML